jgi:ankyrin repeat protein
MIKKSRSKVKIAALLIEHGMVDELKELMEENRNFNLNSINEDGIPLISIAASSGYLDIVQFMLNFNLNINALDVINLNMLERWQSSYSLCYDA